MARVVLSTPHPEWGSQLALGATRKIGHGDIVFMPFGHKMWPHAAKYQRDGWLILSGKLTPDGRVFDYDIVTDDLSYMLQPRCGDTTNFWSSFFAVDAAIGTALLGIANGLFGPDKK